MPRKDGEKGLVHVDELLIQGKSVEISPIGYSMYPFCIPGKDRVVLVPAKEQRYRRGDVVLYRRKAEVAEEASGTPESGTLASNPHELQKGLLVMHRIWKRKGDAYYMVGDNQKAVEGPITREQILGVMVCIYKNGKEISVDQPAYLLMSRVWLWLRPLRPVLSKCIAGLKRK